MGRVYTAEANFSASAGKSLMTLLAPADLVVKVLKIHVGADGNDTNQQMSIELTKITTYGSAAGTSVTPSKFDRGDAASTVTVLSDLGTEPDTYEGVAIDAAGVASLTGYNFEARQGKEPVISPGEAIGLRLLEAITASDLQVMITYEEIGG